MSQLVHDQVQLGEFEFGKLSEQFGLYLILGKRDTGKTTWCRFINSFIPSSQTGLVIVITQNEKLKLDWAQFVPELYIFYPEDLDILDKIRETSNNVLYAVSQNGLSPETKLENSVTIILDDVASDKRVMSNNALRQLASSGRHNFVNMFILSQYIYQVPTHVRTQFDYIFMMQTFSDRNMKPIHKEYLSMMDMATMKAVVQSVTANYGCLVIHTGARSGKFEEMCYHARIPVQEVGRVQRLGKAEQWAYSDQYYFDQNSRVDLCHAKEPWNASGGNDECSGDEYEHNALEVHHVQCSKRTVTVRMMPKLKTRKQHEEDVEILMMSDHGLPYPPATSCLNRVANHSPPPHMWREGGTWSGSIR